MNLDKDILRALDFVAMDDSTFIIPDYSGDSRFCLVNRQGSLLHKLGGIPSSNEDALKNARPALAQAWRSFIDYNSRNGVLAAVTQFGEVLEIYHLKDSTRTVYIVLTVSRSSKFPRAMVSLPASWDSAMFR